MPFREVPYAEDRVLAIDMLRAGYAKAFVPGAVVLHSHDYGSLQAAAPLLRRGARAARGVRLARARVAAAARSRAARRAGRDAARAARGRAWAGDDGRATLAAVTRHHLMRSAGALLGSRADALPLWARRRLSLEGRAGFAPLDLDLQDGHT